LLALFGSKTEAQMNTSETFSESRMDRCAKIQRSIMDNWQRTNSFTYVVRATESLGGADLDQLRKQYFSVGVGDQLQEIPFHDLLVVFSMIEQEFAALEDYRRETNGRAEAQFTINYQISTNFPDEEAVRLLSGIRIEMPFDGGKFLQIEGDET